jgi:NitT/TauT family transport system substrate-binding protein
MKNVARFFAGFLAVFFLFQPFGFAEDAPLENITIAQFGKEKILFYLPLYVAMEEGLFAKRGLDVHLKFAGGPDQVFATVMSGDAQFGVADPVFTAISHEKGGPGKVVALLITKLAVSGVTNKDSFREIKTPADFNGLRISSTPEPSTLYTLLNEFKRKNNLDLTIVQAAPGAQIALLDAGKVDIATDFEPNAAIALDQGYRLVFDVADWTDPSAITGLTTTEDYIAKHPKEVQAVVDALQEAVGDIYSDPQLAYRVTATLFPGMSQMVIHNAVGHMLAAAIYPRSLVITDDLWQRTLKTRLDSGELKKPQTMDVAVDNEFAQRADQDTFP